MSESFCVLPQRHTTAPGPRLTRRPLRTLKGAVRRASCVSVALTATWAGVRVFCRRRRKRGKQVKDAESACEVKPVTELIRVKSGFSKHCLAVKYLRRVTRHYPQKVSKRCRILRPDLSVPVQGTSGLSPGIDPNQIRSQTSPAVIRLIERSLEFTEFPAGSPGH